MTEQAVVTVRPTDLSAYEVFQVSAPLGNHVTIAVKSTLVESCRINGSPRWSIHLMLWGDFGPWEHYWSHCGETDEGWWNWLHSTASDYWLNKMVPGDTDELDFDKTRAEAIRALIRMRWENDIEKDDCRTAYDELRSMDPCGLETFVDRVWMLKKATTHYTRIGNKPIPYKGASETIFDEPWCFAVHRRKPRLDFFWKNVWRPFIEQAKVKNGFRQQVAA